jgi:hypothetical protein
MKGITSGLQPVRLKDGGFPDLSGDGQVTQKDILIGKGVIKKRNGGIAAFAEGGEADSETKLIGKGGILFDPSKPTDYLLAIPGGGAILGLGKMATKAPAIIKAANAAFKAAGKNAKKVGFNVRNPKTGKILSDVDAGKATILGSTRTGQAVRATTAIGVGGKMLPDGSEEEVVETIAPPALTVEAPDTRTFFEKLKDLPGDTYKNLQDDPAFRAKFLAGSMNMMKPVEGIVPVSGVNQFYEGFEAKGKEQIANQLAAAKLAAARGTDFGTKILQDSKNISTLSSAPASLKMSLGFPLDQNLKITAEGIAYLQQSGVFEGLEDIKPGDEMPDTVLTAAAVQLLNDNKNVSESLKKIFTSV